MKRIVITALVLFISSIQIYADTFELKHYFDVGVGMEMDDAEPKVCDYDNNGLYNLIMNAPYQVLFYEYGLDDTFRLKDSIVDTAVLSVFGIGDPDFDGLNEIVLRRTYTDYIEVYEQRDTFSFFDTLTWVSDSIYDVTFRLGITNKFKHDGKDRIYGSGLPDISTSTYGWGFYYYDCEGDNQYSLNNRLAENDWIQRPMSIGNLDKDSLTDVIITSPENYIYIYEASDMEDTNFIKLDSISEGTFGSGKLMILPDIDKDGTNEIMKCQINYGGFLQSYAYLIYEKDSLTGKYDTIFRRDFEVWSDAEYVVGQGFDVAEIDGDGWEEIAICGGRHLEVWDVVGDNQFSEKWEWTNYTDKTLQPHVICFDFNRNGLAEVLYTGTAQYIDDQQTFVFECDTTRDPEGPIIDSAVAYDGYTVESGVGFDDYVKIYFDRLTTEFALDKHEVDTILRLSSGHTWLSGNGFIDTLRWERNGNKSVLSVELSALAGSPSVNVGDTIYPDSSSISSFEYFPLKSWKPVVITGSFGPPAGISSKSEGAVFDLSFKGLKLGSSLLEYTTYTKDTRVEVYDITGRNVLSQKSSQVGLNTINISSLRSGIYFIRLTTPNESISNTIIRMY